MATLKQPTGIDVARLAGVSKSAVSRAFTGGSVSDEARQRIFDAARELRYRPSQAARSLKTNRSRLVGLAVTHLDNQFYPEVIERISDTLAIEGYRLVLFITRGEAELEPVIYELLGFSLDGVILASGAFAARVAHECVEAAMPVIMFNNIDKSSQIPGVSADNTLGGETVARHFIERGHKRIAVITGVADSSTSKDRTEGFCRAVSGAGLPMPTLVNGNYTVEGAAEAMNALLARPDAPTAVFCVNDHMAFSAIGACQQAGVQPGRDIAIAGFDNVGIAGWPSFALTSYAQPVTAMIERCVSRLMAEIGGQADDTGTECIPGKLIIRQSSDFHVP
ncbi:DNA-binding transcriptional regulator, LacI/PurR family [Novosphingobium sp. CF614]|uniref:LacI family DNA-binding transcriptional regulator n=1 Tax=Novosphingobium sp. CF614 TaxID=1884364 RepID=UPI0008EF713A|nr:LacI family DNA-binding transcriptional regulator [Novosphingobium sp. CF614]SFG42351.1 DNA-binding transcriptional regulator, LacI/PurR family [Novosphingobium sp. CF614]